MPRVDLKAQTITYDSEDMLSGLVPQAGTGIPIIPSGADTLESFDPFRLLGYGSSGELVDTPTNASLVTALLRRGVYDDTTQEVYAVGGDLLHEVDPITGDVTDDADWPYTITGTGPDASDSIKYDANVSSVLTELILYTTKGTTAADGDMGRFDPSSAFSVGNNPDDNFLSTLHGGAPFDTNNEHPLVTGDDDITYIGDGNKLHAYDGATGANGTYTKDAHTIKRGFIIKSFAKTSPRTLVIFASTTETATSKKGQVQAFFWDYLSETDYNIEEIWGSRCGGAFEYKNSMGVFTGGPSPIPGANSYKVHLSLWDGERFILQHSLKESSEPIHGGVEVLGDSFIKANVSGKLYTFGSPFKSINAGIQKIANLGANNSGMLITASSGVTLTSSFSGSGSLGKINVMNGGYAADGLIQTSFALLNFPENKRGRIAKVRMEFNSAVTGGRSLQIALVNRQGATVTIFQSDTITAGKTIIEKKYDTSNDQPGIFDDLQLQAAWSGGNSTGAPAIKKVKVYYDVINIKK